MCAQPARMSGFNCTVTFFLFFFGVGKRIRLLYLKISLIFLHWFTVAVVSAVCGCVAERKQMQPLVREMSLRVIWKE